MTTEGPRADSAVAEAEELRAELSRIEHAIDTSTYQSGPWRQLLTRTRAASDEERRAISDDITRISRKLHLRRNRKTVSAQTGIMLEVAAIGLGGVLLAIGIRMSSNVAGIAGLALWVMAFQPIVKVAIGTALGVGYDYAYLQRGEPRFKMKYGSYLARPRSARIALHLSGAIGSPLGAYLSALLVRDSLPVTYMAATRVFWLVSMINLALLVAGLSGSKRLGGYRTVDSSCGAAGAEIREALGR